MFDENFEIHRPITARTIKFALSTLRSLFQTNYWYFNRLFFTPVRTFSTAYLFRKNFKFCSHFLAVAGEVFQKVAVENENTDPSQHTKFLLLVVWVVFGHVLIH